MNNQKTEIVNWWWNRVLPKRHQKLADLSDLSEKELELLKHLKQQYLFAKNLDIDLGWGDRANSKTVF